MKKTVMLALIIVVAILILFLPIPLGTYDDGGTKVYSALTYKIVAWHRLQTEYDEEGDISEINYYQKTSVFFFPDNFKSLGNLWNIEQKNAN